MNIITISNDEENEETIKEVLYIKEFLEEYDLEVTEAFVIKKIEKVIK